MTNPSASMFTGLTGIFIPIQLQKSGYYTVYFPTLSSNLKKRIFSKFPQHRQTQSIRGYEAGDGTFLPTVFPGIPHRAL